MEQNITADRPAKHKPKIGRIILEIKTNNFQNKKQPIIIRRGIINRIAKGIKSFFIELPYS